MLFFAAVHAPQEPNSLLAGASGERVRSRLPPPAPNLFLRRILSVEVKSPAIFPVTTWRITTDCVTKDQAETKRAVRIYQCPPLAAITADHRQPALWRIGKIFPMSRAIAAAARSNANAVPVAGRCPRPSPPKACPDRRAVSSKTPTPPCATWTPRRSCQRATQIFIVIVAALSSRSLRDGLPRPSQI